jgi:hypothetical protein
MISPVNSPLLPLRKRLCQRLWRTTRMLKREEGQSDKSVHQIEGQMSSCNREEVLSYNRANGIASNDDNNSALCLASWDMVSAVHVSVVDRLSVTLDEGCHQITSVTKCGSSHILSCAAWHLHQQCFLQYHLRGGCYQLQGLRQ